MTGKACDLLSPAAQNTAAGGVATACYLLSHPWDQVDPLIRQLTLYRDLIDRTTGDPS